MKNKDIYYDCSPQSSNFADRNISSSWTPYGYRENYDAYFKFSVKE